MVITTLAALVIVLVPAWIIQPFKAQSERGLEWSYALRAWSPLGTIVASAIVLTTVIWLWSGARRWWRKSLLIVALIPTLAFTWLARQNHFEWMFNPLPKPTYTNVSEAGFAADTDMVLAIENNGEAAAYPVLQLAYHHVVHDVVGGIPVVVTY